MPVAIAKRYFRGVKSMPGLIPRRPGFCKPTRLIEQRFFVCQGVTMADTPNTQIIIRHIAGAKTNRIDPFVLCRHA